MPLSADRFPYDRPSLQALITLVQASKPYWRVYESNVEFRELMHVPMVGNPGRTFIEVYNRDLGVKKPFFYRRLSLATAMEVGDTGHVDLLLPSDVSEITKTELIGVLNDRYRLYLEPTDVEFSDQTIRPDEDATETLYRLTALPGSYVWYSYVDIRIVFGEESVVPFNVRLLEDGEPRLMENGEYRLLEEGSVN